MDNSDPLRDYGPSPYDVRHISVAANYELPFGKGKSTTCLDRQTWRSAGGSEYDLPGAHGPGLDRLAPRPVVPGHTCSFERPDRLCRATPTRRARTMCMQHQLLGARSPGHVRQFARWHPARPALNADFGLSKDIHFDETYATFKIEAFNVFNHPNFALSQETTNIASPDNFGRILNTFSAPRIVELVIKFTY
jgi:hypothetical protein